MERVLVTGAGGFIGTTLVPLLIAEGYAVRAVDRFFFGDDLLSENAALERVREDARRIRPEHLEGVDHVLDLASISNDPTGELFQDATWEINWQARSRLGTMAKKAGIKRYVLPSSCSIYGFQSADHIADETSATNPLTTYAKANEKAEIDVLKLAGEDYCVTVLRQATVFGLSQRMRFDLAINGMTFGAWKSGRLPLMRDGKQWRPMIHVKDASRALMFMLSADADKINGQIFNVGSTANNYQIGPLGEKVAARVPREVEIEWYGDPDHRSYRVSFDKIAAIGYRTVMSVEDGVDEICQALDEHRTDMTTETITVQWYQELEKWHKIICNVELNGGVLDI